MKIKNKKKEGFMVKREEKQEKNVEKKKSKVFWLPGWIKNRISNVSKNEMFFDFMKLYLSYLKG